MKLAMLCVTTALLSTSAFAQAATTLTCDVQECETISGKDKCQTYKLESQNGSIISDAKLRKEVRFGAFSQQQDGRNWIQVMFNTMTEHSVAGKGQGFEDVSGMLAYDDKKSGNLLTFFADCSVK